MFQNLGKHTQKPRNDRRWGGGCRVNAGRGQGERKATALNSQESPQATHGTCGATPAAEDLSNAMRHLANRHAGQWLVQPARKWSLAGDWVDDTLLHQVTERLCPLGEVRQVIPTVRLRTCATRLPTGLSPGRSQNRLSYAVPTPCPRRFPGG